MDFRVIVTSPNLLPFFTHARLKRIPNDETENPGPVPALGFTQNLAGIETGELHQFRGSDRPVNDLL